MLSAITIASIVAISVIGTAYAAPNLTVTPQSNNQALEISWNEPDFSDTNILFYIVQVIEEKCRDGNTNCNEFERIHHSETTYPGDSDITVNVEYGKFYTVQVSTAAIQNGNYVISTDSGSKLTGQTIGDEPGPGHNDKPIVQSMHITAMSYTNGNENIILGGSGSGNGHAITAQEWVIKDKNGRIVHHVENAATAIYYTDAGQRDDYYTISMRVFNGIWSDPSIITIDWEPQKQDVIKQVKEKIEYTKENHKKYSEKVWNRVLLALDSSIPENSEYRYDPTKVWSSLDNSEKLTPFDLSNGKSIGDKHRAAADKALEKGELDKYEHRKALAELWYNIWAHR